MALPPITSPGSAFFTRAETGFIKRPPRLSYPPYGYRISKILRQPELLKTYACCAKQNGDRATIWISNGPDAREWIKAHPNHLAVAIPFDADPKDYRWDFLRGHEPILLLPPAADLIIAIRQFQTAFVSWGVKSLLTFGSRNSEIYTAKG